MTKRIALGLLWVAYVLNTSLFVFLIMMVVSEEKHCRIIGDCSGAGIAEGWIIFFFCLPIFFLIFFITTTWFFALKNKDKDISISHRVLAIVSVITLFVFFIWRQFFSLNSSLAFKIPIFFFALILVYCIIIFFTKKPKTLN